MGTNGVNSTISSDRLGSADAMAGRRYAALRAGLRQPHLPALDGLRAIAVALVIFFHAGFLLPGGFPIPGGLGVLIFFVLSGFLITWLLLKEVGRTGTVSLKNFYIRRCLRIFPAFYAYATLCLILLHVMKSHVLWPQVWASLLYVNNYYQGLHGDPNTAFSHTWSLSVEEQFYLLWPSLFLLWMRRQRDLAMLLASAIVLVWVYRLALLAIFHVNHGYVYESFETRADSLLAGCLVAVLLWEGKAERFFAWACTGIAPTVIGSGLLLVSVALELEFRAAYRDTIGLGLDSILVAILIVQMISFHRHPIGQWLNWRWMRWLGTLSYSLYLYQQIAVRPAERIASRLPLVTRPLAVGAGVLICAIASYYIVEQPMLRLKERFTPAAEVPTPSPQMVEGAGNRS